jgi:hypothetical protein
MLDDRCEIRVSSAEMNIYFHANIVIGLQFLRIFDPRPSTYKGLKGRFIGIDLLQATTS